VAGPLQEIEFQGQAVRAVGTPDMEIISSVTKARPKPALFRAFPFFPMHGKWA
jgi:hypothetical protein